MHHLPAVVKLMESAIPSHLQCPRTRPVRASEDYTPPYPSWVARMDPSVKQVAMAYLGVQYRGSAAQTTARRAILRLMVRAMNFDLKLRLYHEVAVVPAHDQTFEYINGHSGTGLLRCAKAG